LSSGPFSRFSCEDSEAQTLTVWHIVLVGKQRQLLACVKISILSS
jgi:hypothetical protein